MTFDVNADVTCKQGFVVLYLPPANEVCEGYVFTGVCHSVHEGACVVALGGACVVALGEACVVALGGACMVAPGGHVWLLWGVCMVAPRGACVVAPRGAWLLRGACMVAAGGHAWFFGGACVVFRGGVRGFFDEIRSMSGRYASFWNAFLFYFISQRSRIITETRVTVTTLW